MLVLSRRPNERIMIGDDIEVTVLSVEGGVVRLGISAPDSLRIVRREIVDQVGQANRAATIRSGSDLPVVAAWRRRARE